MQDGRKGVFLVKENVICLFFDIFTHNPTLQEGMNPPLRQFISTNPATLSLSGTEALPFATLYPRVTRLAQGKTCLQSLKGSCKTISQKKHDNRQKEHETTILYFMFNFIWFMLANDYLILIYCTNIVFSHR